MNWKKLLYWSLLVMSLLNLMIVTRPRNTPEYDQIPGLFKSLNIGNTILLSEGVEMRRGIFFVWVTGESGFLQPYLVLFNTCNINIPFKLTSAHWDNSVARVPVFVCNIEGDMYYRVPMSS